MNTDGSKNLVIYQDRERWENQLHEDLNRFYQEDKNFKICICSQSSSEADLLGKSLQSQFPHLTIKTLLGTDSGETKREFMENIDETIEPINVFFLFTVQ